MQYKQGDLDNVLGRAIESFDASRVDAILETISGEDGVEMDHATSLEHLGTHAAKVARNLVGDVSDLVAKDWRKAREMMERQTNRPFVLESLQVEIAREHCAQTRAMAERCFEVTQQVLPKVPSKVAGKYLSLLTRSYIAGFYPETTMLAGSVLEQELQDTFQRKKIPMPATAFGRSEMKSRIAAARQFGWLTESGQKAAETVWVRRNKTIHNDPDISSRCLETVQLTVHVLQQLIAVR